MECNYGVVPAQRYGPFSGVAPSGQRWATGPIGWVVLLAFVAVYLGGQSFVYVEGDDAATIAYHALGRNAAIQAPYSAYNGMMDLILSFLPAREPVVRIFAMAISSLAAITFVLFTLRLVGEWLGEKARRHFGWIAGITLLTIPELFFFGLVYTPNVVAMSLLLGAHLVLRRALRRAPTPTGSFMPAWSWMMLSLVLFGIGVACRWETAAYGLVIVVDVWLGIEGQKVAARFWPRFFLGGVWGALALLSAFVFIVVSGYGGRDLYLWVQGSRQASAGLYDTGFTLFTFLGRHQTLFTPVGVVLVLVGFGAFIRQRPALAVRALIGFLPLLPLFYRGAPKLLLPAVPGLVLCLAKGFHALWYALPGTRANFVLRASVLVLTLAPWFIGVRLHSSDTQWGPGFEVRTASPAPAESGLAIPRSDASRQIGISHYSPAWWDGFAVATPEGPRPVGAYAAVLFGGGWRSMVNTLEAERRAAITQAIKLKRPILQDDGNSLIVVHLLEMGFTTDDARKEYKDGLNQREFVHSRGDRVTVVQLQDKPTLFRPAQVEAVVNAIGGHEVILYSNYSSSLRKLFQVAPHAARSLGPFSAQLDLAQLKDAIQNKQMASSVREITLSGEEGSR